MPKAKLKNKTIATAQRSGGCGCSAWLGDIDRGIRYAVKILSENGVETYESCSGEKNHAFLEPTIRFHGVASEGYRAAHIALVHGLPIWELRRFWSVTNGELTGPTWEMTFHRGPLARLQTEMEKEGKVSAASSYLDRVRLSPNS
jgi:hypothetical protein